jgi:multisubunit Na+/H+ antiporter MnhE subunit
MSNNHGEKYFTKLLFGFGFVTGAIFLWYYSNTVKLWKNDWYFWGLCVAILFNVGFYLFIEAAVHKVKNDMIKRQRQKEQHKTFTPDN